jgi:SAM-dependent methyltransferase
MTAVDHNKEIRYSSQIKAFDEIIGKYGLKKEIRRILVLGCGNGLEAGYLRQLLGAQVHGVDINQEFHPWALQRTFLQNYNGDRLPYSDGFFDAVYSYHVLEHVQQPAQTLAEVRRVVRPGGFVYIGVPNKSRFIGYVGMNDKSLYRKIRQNVNDLVKRFKGEWENALGAHAGFNEEELASLLSAHFQRIEPVTRFYYYSKWQKYIKWLRILETLSLDRRLMPSVYVLAAD